MGIKRFIKRMKNESCGSSSTVNNIYSLFKKCKVFRCTLITLSVILMTLITLQIIQFLKDINSIKGGENETIQRRLPEFQIHSRKLKNKLNITRNRISLLNSVGKQRIHKFALIDDFDNLSIPGEKSVPGKIIPTARQRLPRIIIIGMSKAGTRALNDYLTLHSNIKATRKEVHFFDRDGNYSKGYEWYKSQLAYSKEGQLTIERTPGYVVSKKAPERIFKMNSSVKILLVVKEPVTRAISEYVHNCAESRRYRKKTFEEYAINSGTGEVNEEYKPISKSVYFQFMPKWYRIFPKNQIFVVDGDSLVVNPLHELQKLEKFLGVKPELTENNFYFNETKGFYCMKRLKSDIPVCLSENKGRPHPVINPEVREMLHDYFRPKNEKFFQQVGRRFNWP